MNGDHPSWSKRHVGDQVDGTREPPGPTALATPSAAVDASGLRHRARLDRSLDVVQALVVLSFAVVTFGLGPWGPVTILLGVAEIALALDLARAGVSRAQLWTSVALIPVAALVPVHRASDIPGNLAVAAVLLGGLRVLSPRRWYLFAAAAVAAYTVVWVVVGQAAHVDDVLGAMLLLLVFPHVTGQMITWVQWRADELDRAEVLAEAEELTLVEEQAREQAVVSARRVLHDDVLNALLAIRTAHPHRLDSVRSAALAATTAVTEVVATETGTPPVDGSPARIVAAPGRTSADAWGLLVARMCDRAPVQVHIEPADVGAADIADAVAALPDVTRDAIVRAVREALRNVARHAGVDTARVAIDVDESQLRVRVVDEGVGVVDGIEEGVGITDAVRGAMAGVGGRAEISSGPDGTTVAITVPRLGMPSNSLLARTYGLTMTQGAEQLMETMLLPLVAMWVLIGTAYSISAPRPAASLLVLVAITTLAAVLRHRLRDRAPTAAWLVGFALAMTALQIAGLAATPDDGLADLRSWSVSYLEVLLIVIAVVLPVRWAAALILSQVSVVLVAVALRPGLGGGPVPVGAVNALVSLPVIAAVLGVALRRNGLAVRRQRDRLVSAYAERARRSSLRRALSLHLEHTRSDVVPWLHDVAEGRIDPTSPEARALAERYGREARDDLHVPGFHDRTLRAEVSAYRQRGGHVDISPGFPAGAHARLSGRLLRDLVTELPAAHRIALTAGPDRAEVRLVITPPPPGPVLDDLRAATRGSVAVDEFAAAIAFQDQPA